MKERIYHLRGHNGIASLVITVKPRLVGSSIYRCDVKWSFCDPRDNFSRKRGVEIAKSKPWSIAFFIKDDDKLLDRFINCLIHRYALPEYFGEKDDVYGHIELLGFLKVLSRNLGNPKTVF